MGMTRTSKKAAKAMLASHPQWHCADFGCKRSAWKEADVAVDLDDLSSLYAKQGRTFVQADICATPFASMEFDFVIASHVLEHIENVGACLTEMQRVAHRGYIEVPTPLFDNLVFGNVGDHKWLVTFDDVTGELVFQPRVNYVHAMINLRQWDCLSTRFPESAVTAISWEKEIPYRIEDRPAVPNPAFADRVAQHLFGTVALMEYVLRHWRRIRFADIGRVVKRNLTKHNKQERNAV